MEGCHRNYTRWAGDIRVGKCIADLGVRITPEVGFHHEGHDKCGAHMHTCTCTCMDTNKCAAHMHVHAVHSAPRTCMCMYT